MFIPLNVYAHDLYLDELEINNGEISIPFTKYNNSYTITLASDIYSVEFDYKVSSDILVTINNNYDLENNSIVYITLEDSDCKINYYFHILKDSEEESLVFLEDQEVIDEGFMFKYKIYVIPISCLILIFICYKIIYRKSKK
jgi:hypothetical protein